MSELVTPNVRFDGLGASAGAAAEVARLLAERLNHWSMDNPGRRILELQVQTASKGAMVEMTAVIVWVEAFGDLLAVSEVAEAPAGEEQSTVVAIAEEIVAEAQHGP